MVFKEKAEIVDADGLRRIITRVAHEIVERNRAIEDVALVSKTGSRCLTRVPKQLEI